MKAPHVCKVELRFAAWPLTYGFVNLFTRIVAFVMLAIWLSATSSCIAKCAAAADDDICCPKSAGHDAPASPSCPNDNCILASAFTKIGDDQRNIFNASLLAVLFDRLILLPSVESSRCAVFKSLPQIDFIGWQFITRSALPPRAPSFVS